MRSRTKVGHKRIYHGASDPTKRIPDGSAACAMCGKVKKLTSTGRLRAHNGPAGDPCTGGGQIAKAQPVDYAAVAAAIAATPPPTTRVRPPARADADTSRLDAGSLCSGCGRWLPGERSICGSCSRKAGKRQ